MKCIDKCRELNVSCPIENCRYWLKTEKDLNCTFEVIENSENHKMTLRQIAELMNVSHVRIHGIEKKAVQKFLKGMEDYEEDIKQFLFSD